jgi:hypothetical protein
MLKKVIVTMGSWVDWIASPAGGRAISKFFTTISEVGSKAFKFLGVMWDRYFKDKVEWLLTPAGGAALSLWFDRALVTIEKMAKGIAAVGDIIGNIRDALKSDVQKAQEYAAQREQRIEDMRFGFEKLIKREMERGGTFEWMGIKMRATQANIKPFMGQVAQRQLAMFTRDLERLGLDIKPDLKSALVKSFGAKLLEQAAMGYGPLGTGRRKFGEERKLQEFKPMPGSPSVELSRPIAPGAVTAPILPTTPGQISVNAETPTQNRLLGSINNSLDKIARRGSGPRPHSSRRAVERAL